MDMRDVHLSNIEDHAKQFRKIASMYDSLAVMATKEDSQLAPLLDKAGEIVADGLDKSGALLEVLFAGMVQEEKKPLQVANPDAQAAAEAWDEHREHLAKEIMKERGDKPS